MEDETALEDMAKEYSNKDLLRTAVPVTGDIAYYRMVREHEMNRPEKGRIFETGMYMLAFCGPKYATYAMLAYTLAERML